jgi:hypothetical protein
VRRRGHIPLTVEEHRALDRRLVEQRTDLTAITAPRWRVTLCSRAVTAIDALRAALRSAPRW